MMIELATAWIGLGLLAVVWVAIQRHAARRGCSGCAEGTKRCAKR